MTPRCSNASVAFAVFAVFGLGNLILSIGAKDIKTGDQPPQWLPSTLDMVMYHTEQCHEYETSGTYVCACSYAETLHR